MALVLSVSFSNSKRKVSLIVDAYLVTSKEKLEQFRNEQDQDALVKYLEMCRDYIYCLEIRELLSHLPLNVILSSLPYLITLKLTYG